MVGPPPFRMRLTSSVLVPTKNICLKHTHQTYKRERRDWTSYPTVPSEKATHSQTTYLLTSQWIPLQLSSPLTPSSLSLRRHTRPLLPLMPTAAQAAAASLHRGHSLATQRFTFFIIGKYLCTLSPALSLIAVHMFPQHHSLLVLTTSFLAHFLLRSYGRG